MVQVTNIAPQATKDQMQTLFGYLGKIEDIRLYPTIRDVSCPVQSRICYIKFMDSVTVGIAQHMTNTVFIDRALIVIPVQSGDIPDEYYALEMTKNGTIVPGLCPQEPKLPPNVVNTIVGTGTEQVIVTTDPQLEVNALPSYPPLPANYDSCKIEEIRRTLLLPNVEQSITADDIVNYFKPAGEVKYVRFCSRTSDNTRHALIEFNEQPSIIEALKLNGNELNGKPIKLLHSIQAIVKPQAKSNEAAQREIEEAMSRVKEAQSLISAAIDPVIGMLSKDKRTSRRSRSRSRGRRRRSRSRSRSRHRKRSTSRSRRTRSRERERRRRSRSRRRSTSRSSRSPASSSSRSRRSRSRRSRSKTSTRKERSGRRSRDRSRSKEKSRGRSREREPRSSKDKRESNEKRCESSSDKERSSVDKKRSSRSSSRYRSRSRERRSNKRERRRSRSRNRRRTPSPRKHVRRSRSRSSRDRDHAKKKDRKERKERSASRSKVPRNYDEEEKGFDSEKRSNSENDSHVEKDSSEKSDNMDISNSP